MHGPRRLLYYLRSGQQSAIGTQQDEARAPSYLGGSQAQRRALPGRRIESIPWRVDTLQAKRSSAFTMAAARVLPPLEPWIEILTIDGRSRRACLASAA